MQQINGTYFDLDYCRLFTPAKLRLIYNGESELTLTLLIAEVHPEPEQEKKKPTK